MNAREELLKITTPYLRCKCAYIYLKEEGQIKKEVILKENYTPEELERFFELLDFDYDNNTNEQKICGAVWVDENLCLIRAVDEDSEWWSSSFRPTIPDFCYK